ncbi:MAG TPA: signal peptidase I [Streptosporangiaceae bacterium]|jgi:signal peptidase I|nr:signal peptidase I [Streptosporangiaceae bacterium]
MLFGLAIVAVVAGILLGARSMRAYRDPSTGMEPAIKPGDRLSVVVSQNVRRGDVIVFTRPGLDVAYVKRVIGLPGDRVGCCNAQGRITVDGKPLDETYIDPDGPPSRSRFSVTLKPGQMWAMGDNRDISLDSRSWGPVPTSGITGRVVEDVSAATTLRTPQTFVAEGLAPPDHRAAPDAGPIALAGSGLLAVVMLAVFGTIRFFVWRHRSRRPGRGPSLSDPRSGAP